MSVIFPPSSGSTSTAGTNPPRPQPVSPSQQNTVKRTQAISLTIIQENAEAMVNRSRANALIKGDSRAPTKIEPTEIEIRRELHKNDRDRVAARVGTQSKPFNYQIAEFVVSKWEEFITKKNYPTTETERETLKKEFKDYLEAKAPAPQLHHQLEDVFKKGLQYAYTDYIENAKKGADYFFDLNDQIPPTSHPRVEATNQKVVEVTSRDSGRQGSLFMPIVLPPMPAAASQTTMTAATPSPEVIQKELLANKKSKLIGQITAILLKETGKKAGKEREETVANHFVERWMDFCSKRAAPSTGGDHIQTLKDDFINTYLKTSSWEDRFVESRMKNIFSDNKFWQGLINSSKELWKVTK